MAAARRTNAPIFVSYAVVVALAAFVVAAHDALAFRPGGEFGSPGGTFLFMFVLVGFYLFALGALPIAAIVLILTILGRIARLPWLVGVIYALLFVGGAGIGHSPIAAALVATALVFPLAFVLAPRVVTAGV